MQLKECQGHIFIPSHSYSPEGSMQCFISHIELYRTLLISMSRWTICFESMQHLIYSFWNTKEPRKHNNLKTCDLITLNILPNNFFHNQNTYFSRLEVLGMILGELWLSPQISTPWCMQQCPHLFRWLHVKISYKICIPTKKSHM